MNILQQLDFLITNKNISVSTHTFMSKWTVIIHNHHHGFEVKIENMDNLFVAYEQALAKYRRVSDAYN
jgi:hypothetical protein